MAISCDPNALVSAARCFSCLPLPTLNEIDTYLLCQWFNHKTPACNPPVVSNLILLGFDDQCITFSFSCTRDPLLGFNVYFGTTPGGPYNAPNSPVLNPCGTVPPDRSIGICVAGACPPPGSADLTPNVTYYVVITALDAVGCESAPSNEASGMVVQ